MARLEYRLLDDNQEFPVLYYYDQIALEEIELRFACDYFVKLGTVFAKTSCAIEEGVYIIYVTHSQNAPIAGANTTARQDGSLQLEVREHDGLANYPLITTYAFLKTQELLLHLLSDYLYLNGHEWLKEAAQIDEDRRLYIYYAKQTDIERKIEYDA